MFGRVQFLQPRALRCLSVILAVLVIGPLLAIVSSTVAPKPAAAASGPQFNVFVGYADNVRPSPEVWTSRLRGEHPHMVHDFVPGTRLGGSGGGPGPCH
jgi:hypothetical protein